VKLTKAYHFFKFNPQVFEPLLLTLRPTDRPREIA